MTRATFVPGIILVLVAMGVFTRSLWFSASTSRWDTPDLKYCRAQYQAARSKADSTRVDGMVRPAGEIRTTGLTCGVLRDGYPDFFWSRHKGPS